MPVTRLFFVSALLTLTASCTLRYAPSNYREALLDDASRGLPVEGGLYFWEGRAFGERGDLGLFGTYEAFDFFTNAAATHLEFRTRWFPRERSLLEPFLGGGLGIYRLNRTKRNPLCRRNSICLEDQFEARGQATGLTPHAAFGTEVVPGSGRVAVVREFGVFDPEWDLTAWRFSMGLTVRPER